MCLGRRNPFFGRAERPACSPPRRAGRSLLLTRGCTHAGTVPKHARVVAGGSAAAGPGYFVRPTVVADLRQEDEMVRGTVLAGPRPAPTGSSGCI